MKHGFIKVACASPKVTVANPAANGANIAEYMKQADAARVNLCVFPELAITGCTCADLFLSGVLLESAKAELLKLKELSRGMYPVFVVGLPLIVDYKLYNCAAVIHDGWILAIVPKQHLPNFGESYEARTFTACDDMVTSISLGGDEVPVLTGAIFAHEEMDAFRFGVEIADDLWAADPPSRKLCAMGAAIILNAGASSEAIGREEYRRMLVNSTSARLVCGYACANADASESTQDVVYSAHNLISENGVQLAESLPFENNGLLISDIDVDRIAYERRRMNTYAVESPEVIIPFNQEIRENALTRAISPAPFGCDDPAEMARRCETILNIQAHGLKKRIEITYSKTIVVGISGGLDSCLALLVMARAMDLMGRDRKDIHAISMPCFGTTSRTRSNAQVMCEQLGVNFREISIADSVRAHFRDIGHDESVRDVTYENSQARERTQVLMDFANQVNGLVIGTGDLSELALGWATYNGDHMSMYGVNGSIPKTLIRSVVRHIAMNSEPALKAVLLDILDTPVSPELLPAQEDGTIKQKTEDIVGPYELHDFFLFYTVRCAFAPDKIFRMAKLAFNGEYDDETIRKWLTTFTRRFFMQQFKRSCLPDGPRVGSAALSPRGDWRMPTDASSAAWLSKADC